jgi:dienelactone hydrolase
MQGCLKQLASGLCLMMVPVSPGEGSDAPAGPWDTQALFEMQSVLEPTDQYPISGLESFFYSSVDWNGAPTKVYAYLGLPSGEPPSEGWPAVVLVHGGGGTAFREWVQRWNQRGFAALAMDLEGRLPDRTVPFDQRPRFDGSGPARVGVWGDADLPPEQQWFYHAVTQVILGNNVLRSRPEIDGSSIGVMGVSWGGIITSVIAGVDPRFRFAIPVYGCGFMDGADGPIGTALARYTPQRLERILEWWEPSIHLPHARMPVLFINGTNDSHFPLNAWQQSADAVVGGSWQSARRGLTHGHVPPQLLEEPYYFAAAVLDGSDVPRISVPAVDEFVVSAQISDVDAFDPQAVEVRLAYTVETGNFLNRQWQTIPAEINGNQLSAAFPASATAWFFELESPGEILLTSAIGGL